MEPKDIPLHEVDTAKGHWGIFVQSVVKAQNDNIFLIMILEQRVDDERFRMRRLEMLILAAELISPAGRAAILRRIREWIEATEGDGYLDLVSSTR